MKVLLQVPSAYPERLKVFMQSFNEHMKPHFPEWDIYVAEDTKKDCYIAKLRLQNVELHSEYDYIMQCDDDFVWNKDCREYYRMCMDILSIDQPNVLCVYGRRYPKRPQFAACALLAVNRGMFVITRKITNDSKWLKEVREIQGGCTDTIIAYKALENNGKLMVIGKSPLELRFTHTKMCKLKPMIHDREHANKNAFEYIRNRYDKDWKFESGIVPMITQYKNLDITWWYDKNYVHGDYETKPCQCEYCVNLQNKEDDMGIDIEATHNNIEKLLSEKDLEKLTDSKPGSVKHIPKQKQIGGDHYTKLKIQPFEYCHANKIQAAEGSIIKYVTRHRDKGGSEDLRKAIHLLELLLEAEYGERYDFSN